MSSKTTRFEILLEAGHEALVGMSPEVWRSFAEHQVACVLDRSTRASGFDREPSGRLPDGSESPVSISLCRSTWGVLFDHGGA